MTQILVVLLIDRSHVSASFTYPSLAQVGFFTYQSLAHVGIRHSQYESLLFLYAKCFDCPHTVWSNLETGVCALCLVPLHSVPTLYGIKLHGLADEMATTGEFACYRLVLIDGACYPRMPVAS